MPICIECRYPVPQLYHVLHSSNKRGTSANQSTKTAENGTQRSSAAETKPKPKPSGGAAGGDVRLTQCPRCKRFADKYVEHDFVVLFIDLVLVKPQVSISICLTRQSTILHMQKLTPHPSRSTAISSSTASPAQTTNSTYASSLLRNFPHISIPLHR